MGLVKRGRQIGQTIKNAARLRKIVSVFAKHGFHNIAERARLGRFVLEKIRNEELSDFSLAERLKMSFEELGPSFVKLGQILATRPDLIPDDFVEEFKKLHTQVNPISFEEIQKALISHFKSPLEEVFSYVDYNPIGSASIAQVHKAILKNGHNVVIKVQRPGIVEIIKNDVNILYQIAELLEKYVPETRPYNPIGIVDNFFKTLELETNFIVESNNMRKFAQNFDSDLKIKIPHVYMEYSGSKVIVMEELQGVPLSSPKSFDQEGIVREEVVRVGLRGYMQMVFRDGLFHADLHAGNLLLLPNNRIGLIDFGMVGRLNHRTKDSIANMLLALSGEDYDRLAYEFIDLAPYNEQINVDVFARELRDLIAPYFGLTIKNVNMGRLLIDSATIAARHHLIVPSELMLFFKSLVTVEGLGHLMVEDFDLLPYTLDFAKELIKNKYNFHKINRDLTSLGRDVSSLLTHLPRQIKQIGRKFTSPNFSLRLDVKDSFQVIEVVETASRLLFLGLIISALIIGASSLLFLEEGPRWLGMPLVSTIQYFLAVLFASVAFYQYMK